MLTITSQTTPDSTRLTLEGRLTGPWADELDQARHAVRRTGTGPVVVDLTDVAFVGENGRALLNRIWREDAVQIAQGCCTKHMVAEITGSHSSSIPCRTK